MTQLTDVNIAFIRDYIGDAEPPDDFDLQDIYDRTGSLMKVVHAVLTNRLANYLATAASYSIVGVYQESSQANIDNLRQLIKDMEENNPELTTDPEAGDTGAATVRHMVRFGRSR